MSLSFGLYWTVIVFAKMGLDQQPYAITMEKALRIVLTTFGGLSAFYDNSQSFFICYHSLRATTDKMSLSPHRKILFIYLAILLLDWIALAFQVLFTVFGDRIYIHTSIAVLGIHASLMNRIYTSLKNAISADIVSEKMDTMALTQGKTVQ
jgi:hypothetical protein